MARRNRGYDASCYGCQQLYTALCLERRQTLYLSERLEELMNTEICYRMLLEDIGNIENDPQQLKVKEKFAGKSELVKEIRLQTKSLQDAKIREESNKKELENADMKLSEYEAELDQVKKRFQEFSEVNVCLEQEKAKLQETVDEESKRRNELETQVKVTNDELRNKMEEYSKLQSEKHSLNQQVLDTTREKDKIQERGNKLEKEVKSAKELNVKIAECSKLQSDNHELKRRVSNLDREIKRLQGMVGVLERDKKCMQDDINIKVEECSKVQSENKSLSQQVLQLTNVNEISQKIRQEARQHLENKMKALEEKGKELQKLQSEKRQLITENSDLQKSKDDALSRLSKAAGAKLSQGNPAITDLSDENRPTKLAEKFSEIYDNSWTDAYETLTDDSGLDDPTAINILLEVFKLCYNVCVEKEQEYSSKIKQAVLAIPSESHSDNETKDAAPALDSKGTDICLMPSNIQVEKSINELKLQLGQPAGSIIAQVQLPLVEKYLKQKVPNYEESSFRTVTEFARQCTTLSWLTRIRDPSVHIDFSIQKGGKCDWDRYRQYTKSGNHVNYLVWPTLYLHEGGALLAKGVIQPSA